ncbi:MAG: hypothetical protein WDW38_008888 [Sanguina aurantia]
MSAQPAQARETSKRTAVAPLPGKHTPPGPSSTAVSVVQQQKQQPPQPRYSPTIHRLSILPTHPHLSSTTSVDSLPVTVLRSFTTIHAAVTAANAAHAAHTHSSLSEPAVPPPASALTLTDTASTSSPLPLALPSSRAPATAHLRIRFSSSTTHVPVSQEPRATPWRTPGGHATPGCLTGEDRGGGAAASPPPGSGRGDPHDHVQRHLLIPTPPRHGYVRRVANGIPAPNSPTSPTSPARSGHSPTTAPASAPCFHTLANHHGAAVAHSQASCVSASTHHPATTTDAVVGAAGGVQAQQQQQRRNHSFQALLSLVTAPLPPSSRLLTSGHTSNGSVAPVGAGPGGGRDMEAATSSTSASALLVRARRPAAVRRRSTFSDLIARDALYAMRAAERAADKAAALAGGGAITVLDDAPATTTHGTPSDARAGGSTGVKRRSRSFEDVRGAPALAAGAASEPSSRASEPQASLSPALASAYVHRQRGSPLAPATSAAPPPTPSTAVTPPKSSLHRQRRPLMQQTQAPDVTTGLGSHVALMRSHADWMDGAGEQPEDGSSWATARPGSNPSSSPPPPPTASPPPDERGITGSRVSRFGLQRRSDHSQYRGDLSPAPLAPPHHTRSSLPINLRLISSHHQQQVQQHFSGIRFPTGDDGGGEQGDSDGPSDRPAAAGGAEGWIGGGDRGSAARDHRTSTANERMSASSRSSAHQLHQLLNGGGGGGLLTGLSLSPRGGGGGGGGRAGGYERRQASGPLQGSSSLRGQMLLDASSCMLQFQQHTAEAGSRYRIQRSDTAM